MLKRPHDFDDVIGHEVFKKYLKERIQKGNLPQFLIFEGPLGLGKTSLAEIVAITLNYGFEKSPQKDKAIVTVIDNGQSIDCIKKYNMAKDSGKDTAKEVLAELTPSMSSTGRKVVICDECHAISEAAQDVFLVETEFIPKNVYLIMCTTDLVKLKGTLVSRAVVIPLKKLTTSQMVEVLSREVGARGLTIQGGDATLRMIAEWADNKPRAALNILNAFGENEIITTEVVREFIGYIDVGEILPLIASLSGSMTYGLTYISDMKIGDSLLDSIVEVLRIKMGQPSFKLSVEDMQRVRTAVDNVPEECIMKFLHKIAEARRITRAALISAFVSSHTSYDRLYQNDKNILNEEIGQKLANRELAPDVQVRQQSVKPPTLDDLLASSGILGESL